MAGVGAIDSKQYVTDGKGHLFLSFLNIDIYVISSFTPHYPITKCMLLSPGQPPTPIPSASLAFLRSSPMSQLGLND